MGRLVISEVNNGVKMQLLQGHSVIFHGGFNSGYADFTYRLAYPFHVNESANNKPIPRSAYGRAAPYYDVYNSVLTANAIAWGLKKAQEREDTEKNP